MTQKELYHYMLAYKQEHQFNQKEQSNFIAMLQDLYSNSASKNERKVLIKKQDHD